MSRHSKVLVRLVFIFAWVSISLFSLHDFLPLGYDTPTTAALRTPAGIFGTTSLRNNTTIPTLSQAYVQSFSQHIAKQQEKSLPHHHQAQDEQEKGEQSLVTASETSPKPTDSHLDRPFHSHLRDGNVLIIAVAPIDECHVVALWSQLECFTSGIDKVVLSAPLGSEGIMDKLVQEMKHKIHHLPTIVVHYVKNDRCTYIIILQQQCMHTSMIDVVDLCSL